MCKTWLFLVGFLRFLGLSIAGLFISSERGYFLYNIFEYASIEIMVESLSFLIVVSRFYKCIVNAAALRFFLI